MLGSINNTFGIIGAGMVGTALGSYLSARDRLGFIYARSAKRIENLRKNGIQDFQIITDFDSICKIPDYFILAVNDNQIETVVSELKETYGPILTGKFIFHTSGTKNADILLPLTEFSCNIFTAHPFQTFYVNSSDILTNLIWGTEIGNSDESDIREIIALLGGSCYFLNEKTLAHKELYHLVAVSASNFLISSIEFSKILYSKYGLEEPKLVEQIIKTSTQNALNYFTKYDEFPLTGPLSRGDRDTLRKHLEILSAEKDLQHIYKYFSKAASLLLLEKKIISAEQFSRISEN